MKAPRGYSRDFPKGTNPQQYLLPDIPAAFWRRVRAKARREGLSIRALVLSLLDDWLGAD